MLLRGRYPHTCGRDEARPSIILTSETSHQQPFSCSSFPGVFFPSHENYYWNCAGSVHFL